MKVKELIRLLKLCDPNRRVMFGTFCGTASGNIRRVIVNDHAPSGRGRVVRLDCKMTHYGGRFV